MTKTHQLTNRQHVGKIRDDQIQVNSEKINLAQVIFS